MKRIVYGILLLISTHGFSQEIPRNLSLAVTLGRSFTPDTPDFTYYSKNFDTVFGLGLFTEDYLSYETQAIYINPDYKMFYNDTYRASHIFNVMPLAGVNVAAFQAMPCNAVYSVESR
jgi:hypothetical protein